MPVIFSKVMPIVRDNNTVVITNNNSYNIIMYNYIYIYIYIILDHVINIIPV